MSRQTKFQVSSRNKFLFEERVSLFTGAVFLKFSFVPINLVVQICKLLDEPLVNLRQTIVSFIYYLLFLKSIYLRAGGVRYYTSLSYRIKLDIKLLV